MPQELLGQVQRCLDQWDELLKRADYKTDPGMLATREQTEGFERACRESGLDAIAHQLKHLCLLFDRGAAPVALRSWLRALKAAVNQAAAPPAPAIAGTDTSLRSLDLAASRAAIAEVQPQPDAASTLARAFEAAQPEPLQEATPPAPPLAALGAVATEPRLITVAPMASATPATLAAPEPAVPPPEPPTLALAPNFLAAALCAGGDPAGTIAGIGPGTQRVAQAAPVAVAVPVPVPAPSPAPAPALPRPLASPRPPHPPAFNQGQFFRTDDFRGAVEPARPKRERTTQRASGIDRKTWLILLAALGVLATLCILLFVILLFSDGSASPARGGPTPLSFASPCCPSAPPANPPSRGSSRYPRG